MYRVGKLAGKNGRHLLAVSDDEYFKLKSLGFKIIQTITPKKTSKIFGFESPEELKNGEIIPRDFEDSMLYKVCIAFFDAQVSRGVQQYRFDNLKYFEKLKRQGRPLSPNQQKIYREELRKKFKRIDSWYEVLKQIEASGYKEEYIVDVITFAMNDFIPKEKRRSQWAGWGKMLLSITTLLSTSSNGLTKWENIVNSYELQREEHLKIITFSDERYSREIVEL